MKCAVRSVSARMGTILLVALLPVAGDAAATPAEKCVSAKLVAARELAVCLLRAQERNLRKPGSANEVFCFEKLTNRWDAIEVKAGPGVCPEERHDLAPTLTSAKRLQAELDLAIRPPTELLIFDAGPLSGEQVSEAGPHALCQAAKPEDLVCRRTPAIVSDASYGPVSSLGSEFSFREGGAPVRSLSGVQIAGHWSDFVEGIWDACLQTAAGPECATAGAVLPDGAHWWHGWDPGTGKEGSCTDWSLPLVLGGDETAFVGLASSDGQGGNPSPWGPLEVECDGFEADAPDAPHLLCLCF